MFASSISMLNSCLLWWIKCLYLIYIPEDRQIENTGMKKKTMLAKGKSGINFKDIYRNCFRRGSQLKVQIQTKEGYSKVY